jgi:hypothetical protein
MALDLEGCNHPFWIDEFGDPVAGMEEWQCNGRVELSDMGTFEDGIWTTGSDMWTDIQEWDSSGSLIEPFANWQIPNGTLTVRNYNDRPGITRLVMNIGVEVLAPVLWQATCVSGVEEPICEEGVPCPCKNGDVSYFMNAIFDGAPELEQMAFDMMDSDRIQVVWKNKGLIADNFIQTYKAVFPKYELYPRNFWNYDRPWVYDADMNFQFPAGVLPEVGWQEFAVHIDYPEGVVFNKTYYVTTTEPMPSVAAFREVEGKPKSTISVKEIKSGLKITWNDPPFKQIQKSGIQLKVYVGNSNNGYEEGNLGGDEIYYWIDSPAQIHKLLIPTENWLPLKTELLAAGFTEAKVLIVYRTIEGGDEATNEGAFMNRGHSDIVTIGLK